MRRVILKSLGLIVGALLAVAIAVSQARGTAASPTAPSPAACAAFARHGRRTDAQACYIALTRTADLLLEMTRSPKPDV